MDDGRWRDLAVRQAGMVARRQLTALGVPRAVVRTHLRAGRWSERTPTVLGTTTGPLSTEQRLWLGVLHAGPLSLVGGLSAAQVHGLRGWTRREVTVLVDDERPLDAVAGFRFFRTRRPLAEFRWVCSELPLCRLEPALLLFAGYEPHARTAQGVLAAAVQQRLTSAEALSTWLERLRPLRRARQFRAVLSDISGGAQSLAEVDLRRACRRFGVVPPRSQRPRFDRSGRRRYTDAEWLLPDGRILVLEVDGAFHDDVMQAAADRKRNRQLTSRNRLVVSCTATELRDDPGSVLEDLVALGVPLLPRGSCA